MQAQVLPHSARYTLSYNGARFRRQELADLLLPGFDFTNEAVYLLGKGLDSHPEVQRAILAAIAGCMRTKQSVPMCLSGIIENAPADFEVCAPELARMSQYGFGFSELYRAQAESCWKNFQVPALLGYSALTGLVSFLEYRQPFYVVIPGKLGRDSGGCGYQFFMYSRDVEALFPDEIRDRSRMVFFPGPEAMCQETYAYLAARGRTDIEFWSVIAKVRRAA